MSHSRLIIALLATLSVFAPAILAADDAKPNTLTKEQAASGWISLFDGETPFGWTIKGSSKIENGLLILGGKGASSPTTASTNSEFSCFELDFAYRGTGNAKLVLGDSSYDLKPAAEEATWTRSWTRIEQQGEKFLIVSTTLPLTAKPTEISDQLGALKEKPVRAAVSLEVPADATLVVRDVKLKPLSLKSVFNGKDLTGWKIIPDHPSKFTVTDKGELNIKNGSGDIQTEAQWADFVLQLDVFSNGSHLNSGVFFRARPGEFWSGYEAQIRNEWDGSSNNADVNKKKEDRTKPFDIGTGGIYNRQPSRKVVSSDKEWFTYTILANGNHIATWVNGYQTADYFDKDKDAENPRKGRFLGKGVISLQGHDPTTDLSFRNIKIQELPEKK